MAFYEAQGIQGFFHPLFGYFDLLFPSQENKTSNAERFKSIINKSQGVQAFAANVPNSTQATIFLYDTEVLKEFLLKEDNFDKTNLMRLDALQTTFGLFFQEGPKFHRSKGLFMKIFAYEGMEEFIPHLCGIIEKYYQEFIQKKGISKDKTTIINLEEMHSPLMLRIANLLIHGDPDLPYDSLECQFQRLLLQELDLMKDLARHPCMIFFPKLALKFGLVKEVREIERLYKEQEKIVAQLLEQKSKSITKVMCIMDRIKAHNKNCEETGNLEERLSIHDIAGDLNIFYFAGTDTSKMSVKNTLCHLALDRQFQQYLVDVNSEIYDNEGKTSQAKLDGSEKLTLFIKESLRVHSPLGLTTIRVAKEDTKVGKLKVKKGDGLMIFPLGFHFNNKFFSKSEEFQIDRFTKEKEKEYPRHQYLPFSAGRRICLGRHLGELMVKLLITQFVKAFEFTKPDGVEFYFKEIAFGFTIRDPVLSVILK